MNSSIAMAADSTQSELKADRKRSQKRKSVEAEVKHKKKLKKAVEKKKALKAAKQAKKRARESSEEDYSDYDSDLDLSKELQPIGYYVRERETLVEHLFHSISGKKLKAMLPEILKTIPVEELKQLCVEEVEVMSKKRIRRILDGADPETISSSGTDDDTTDEEVNKENTNDDTGSAHDVGDCENQIADSTYYSFETAQENDMERSGIEQSRFQNSSCMNDGSPSPCSNYSRSSRQSESGRATPENSLGTDYSINERMTKCEGAGDSDTEYEEIEEIVEVEVEVSDTESDDEIEQENNADQQKANTKKKKVPTATLR